MCLEHLGSFGPKCYIESFDRLLNPDRISIGSSVWVGPHARLEAITTYRGEQYNGHISIGSGTAIGFYVHIGSAFYIEIGQGVTLGSHVTIVDHNHASVEFNVSVMRQPLIGSPIVIGDYCWIGKGAAVLKGVRLGDGCIVGANAVVTRSFPKGTIIAGVPAKIIGHRE